MRLIPEFQGEYRFLSNFYPSEILFNGKIYPTAEHLYQSMKTINPFIREEIRNLSTPGKAKRYGKKIDLRSDWKWIQLMVMLEVLRMKFFQNFELQQKLFRTTGFFLIEGNNWHDNFWGICRCLKCTRITGQNHLGKLLMKVREDLTLINGESTDS